MVKKTSSPKASSSSSVSRNLPATSNRRIDNEFQRNSAFKKNNKITTHDQSMASINGGDFVGYPSSMKVLLIQLPNWPQEKVFKIWYSDPSLLDEIEPSDIVMLAKLKSGSLYLQKVLKDKSLLYFNKILYATLDFTYPLMFDPEGTYVLRKLYSLCDSSHLKLIVEKMIQWPNQLKNAAKNDTGSDTLMELTRVLINKTSPSLLKSIQSTLNSELSKATRKPGSNLFKSCLKDLDSWQNEILYNKAATHSIDLATDDSGYALIALIENAPKLYKKELLLKITDNAAYLSQDSKGTISMDKRFTRGATLQGSSQQLHNHPTNDSDLVKQLFLNNNSVEITVTKNEGTVQSWISTHVLNKKITKIGIAVESDTHELADAISLYVLGHCLLYKVANIRICDDMVDLVRNKAYTFGGKESVRCLLRSKILSDQEGHLIMKTRETLPKLQSVGAEGSYNKEARELRKKSQDPHATLSWRATSLTEDQMRMSCFDAQLGWVLIPFSAIEAQMIISKN